jgi:hypothetical protein
VLQKKKRKEKKNVPGFLGLPMGSATSSGSCFWSFASAQLMVRTAFPTFALCFGC